MRQSSVYWFYLNIFLYALVLVAFSIFSFSFTDPNLVLSSNSLYWNFQQWMWRTWFDHPPLQAQTFVVSITLVWLSFSFVTAALWSYRKQVRVSIVMAVLITTVIGACFISYNALSHDVFNYLFNAKMVVLYQENPHVKVALEFPHDDWLRFMHNTHTPAPYGYGWTAISTVPYMLGAGKFVPSWLLFRVMAVVSLFATGVVLWRWLGFANRTEQRWLLVALCISPIVLFEVVVNMHNDLWMIFPAILSMYLLDRWRVGGRNLLLLASVILLSLSILIKFATVVLVTVLAVVVLSRLVKRSTMISTPDLALIASILLFVPLLTSRSQFFHPWYLLWPLMWLPLIERRWWVAILIGFSVSSTYRYVPWIMAGGFEGGVLLQQQLVTWVGGAVIALIAWLLLRRVPQSV